MSYKNVTEIILDSGARIHLTRWHVGPNPDELGGVAFWRPRLEQLYRVAPFRALFDRLQFEVWHMDHPELDAQTKAKLINLKDFDPQNAGNQTVAGLHDTPGGTANGLAVSRIRLGMFPANWNPDRPAANPAITEAERLRIAGCLPHEFGHRMHHVLKYGGDPFTAPAGAGGQFWVHGTLLFNSLRPRTGHNPSEDFAEVWRACMGTDETMGKFSNGAAYSNARMTALLKWWVWALFNLSGNQIDQVRVGEGWVEWQQLGPVWFPSVETHRLITGSWQRQIAQFWGWQNI